MVTVFVRGLEVRLTLTLAAVFSSAAFLAGGTFFGALGRVAPVVGAVFLVIAVEEAGFLVPALAGPAAFVTLGLALGVVFLAVAMCGSDKKDVLETVSTNETVQARIGKSSAGLPGEVSTRCGGLSLVETSPKLANNAECCCLSRK